MTDCDWLIILPVAVLGLAQLQQEGKLNLKGLFIDPIKDIINLFRRC